MSTADNIASLQSCKRTSDALKAALDSNAQLQNHYENVVKPQWQADHDAWVSRKKIFDTVTFPGWVNLQQSQINTLAAERQNQGGCGLCPNAWNVSCSGGWTQDSVHNCGFLNGGCEKTCKRTPEQVTADLGPWLLANPKPTFTETEPTLVPITYNNIQCCSQLFADNKGATITATLQQKCSQEIDKQIATAESTPAPAIVKPVTITTPTTILPTNLPTNIKIGGVLFILLSSCLILILLVVLMRGGTDNNETF